MPKTLDRRVRRTRRQLQRAILELVMEQDFDSLTVTEITERADLRRATFYLHYRTKEELLLAALQARFDDLRQQSQLQSGGDAIAGKSRPDAYRVTFAHVAENADLYRALISGSGGSLIYQQIRIYLAELVLVGLESVLDDELTVPRPVLAHAIAGAELGLILWWLDAGMPHSPEYMAQMAHKMLLDGVRGVLAPAHLSETVQ